MIDYLFHYRMLTIIVNAFLAFLTTAFLIECALKIFSLKNSRLRSIIKTIPLFKLPIDVWMADWARWAPLHGINPLECAEGSRMFLIECNWIDALSTAVFIPFGFRIGFELIGGYTFSVVDLASPWINPMIVRTISFGFIAFTLLNVLLFVIKLMRHSKLKKQFLDDCSPCYRPVDNLLLSKALILADIKIFVHPYEGSPFLMGFRKSKIIFPTTLLLQLDQKEFEAIIAHEMQHATHKDILVREILDLIKKVFWWVPTKRWVNSIECMQEFGCDQNSSKYNISRLDLASAILKAVKTPVFHRLSGAHLFENKRFKQRIHGLLDESQNNSSSLEGILSYCFGAMLIVTIFFGRFWIL